MRFDPQKLADLVDEESRLKHALTEVSKNLTDLQATDKKWDDERTQDYDRGQLPFDQIIEQLEPHAHKTGKIMQIFGQRAGPAMSALISQGADALREMTTALEQSGGTAQEIADKKLAGLTGAWTKLKSATEGVLIEIGDRLSPVLERLATFLTDRVLPAVRIQRGLGAIADLSGVRALAKGGLVTRPTLALLGERGPEQVIPTDQLGAFGGGGRSGPVTIQVRLEDDTLLAERVIRHAPHLLTQLGRA